MAKQSDRIRNRVRAFPDELRGTQAKKKDAPAGAGRGRMFASVLFYCCAGGCVAGGAAAGGVAGWLCVAGGVVSVSAT